MNEIIAFIPLWIVGFLIGFYAKKINQWLEEEEAIVINTKYGDDDTWHK